jgi:hypothetical protein
MVNGMIAVPCDSDKVSDGVHTFGELYLHRNHLFIALMKSHPQMSWRSLQHDNGSFHDGWFIAGMKTPKGDITYHLPESMWYMLDGIKTLGKAPKFDGHTSQDVLDRLCDWIVDFPWGRKERAQ